VSLPNILTVSAPYRLLQSDRPEAWGEDEERETFTLAIVEPDGVAPPAERDPELLRKLAE
jgi:hypothetical protein